MSIGEKIFNLRKAKNMSQEGLAEVLNVSRQTISKWETGESNPDFDKIVPLCNFFGISTDELLRDNNGYLEKELVFEKGKNRALMISMCIVIFVVMTILLIVLDEVGANDSIMAAVSLVGIGAIAIVLVYYFFSKRDLSLKNEKERQRMKLINSIINLLTIILYVLISFWFNAWAYSWIIIVVGLLLKKIIQLLLMLGEDKDEK